MELSLQNGVNIVLNSQANIVNLSKFAKLEKKNSCNMKNFTVNFIKTLNIVLPKTLHHFVSKSMPQLTVCTSDTSFI